MFKLKYNQNSQILPGLNIIVKRIEIFKPHTETGRSLYTKVSGMLLICIFKKLR